MCLGGIHVLMSELLLQIKPEDFSDGLMGRDPLEAPFPITLLKSGLSVK